MGAESIRKKTHSPNEHRNEEAQEEAYRTEPHCRDCSDCEREERQEEEEFEWVVADNTLRYVLERAQ